ncbi:MAG: dCTP deaminase [Microthrixaceae bacterium]|nr:dCTP deaminase [Microthrixaceae bacterium]
MILADASIRALIDSGALVFDPYEPELVQPASVDVRLGRQFRVMRNSRLTHIDPVTVDDTLMETVNVPDGGPFVLHPGEFALGHTAETLGLPDNVVGIVNGKSSLGRLGVQVHATAGFVDPGFRGVIVLELSNVATLPILLRPGMKVAQMVFQHLDRPAERPYGHPDLGSKYQGQQGATASRYPANYPEA